MSMLLRNLSLPRESRLMDLRVRGAHVTEVGPGLRPLPHEQVMDMHGDRLLPALMDDHLHIGAWLRSMRSQPYPPAGLDAYACFALLRAHPGPAGCLVLFGIDHQHDIAQEMRLLDAYVPHPVLVVHRTGHAAFANAAARKRLATAGLSLRNVSACWRACLGAAGVGEEAALLAQLRRTLLAQGVGFIRDATPSPSGMADRAEFITRALAPVRVSFMGKPDDPLERATHLKVFNPARITPSSRPLAVHATEPDDIHLACGVVDARGRIEHAAVCPEFLVEMVAATGCTVCANPSFMVERDAALRPMALGAEAEFYQPLAQFLEAGIRLTFGSDAPVSAPGAWSGILGAVRRGNAASRFAGARLQLDDALRCATERPELVDACADAWTGRQADLLVVGALSDDLRQAPDIRISMLGGCIYHAQSAQELPDAISDGAPCAWR